MNIGINLNQRKKVYRDREENDGSSKKEEWEFEYSLEKLLSAADKKSTHHADRLAWWENELEQAEAKLIDKGFEYRERRRTQERAVVIVGDPELAERVNECRNSINRHREHKKEYEMWMRILRLQIEQNEDGTLSLKIGDVEFFGL